MRYKLNAGMNYPTSAKVLEELAGFASLPDEERQAQVIRIAKEGGFVRAEAGDVVDNLPEISVPWLLEQGLVEAVEDKPKPVKKPKPESEPVPIIDSVPDLILTPEGE